MRSWYLSPLLLCAMVAVGAADAPGPQIVKVTTHPVNLDELKDVKFEAPTPIPFGGKLPLNNSSGKPFTGRIADDGVYAMLGMAGTKLIKTGTIWAVDASYLDNVVEHYAYKLDKNASGSLTITSAQARQATWNGKQIVLIDTNSNGRYDDAGVDQIIVDKTTALKAGDFLTVGQDEWSMTVSPSGNTLTLSKSRDLGEALKTGDGSPTGALASWNAVRQLLKLQPLSVDKELERIMVVHVHYMMKHGLEHAEDKSSPDYTDDGNRGGMTSVLSGAAADAHGDIITLLDTFYHRVQMLDPDLALTGIYHESGFGGANTLAGARKEVHFIQPILYPPANAIGVRTRWYGHEGPSPIPEEPPRGGVGETVTLTLAPGQKVSNGKIVMHEGSATGPNVDAYTSSPDKPAPGGAGMFPDNMSSFCLIAKAPLKVQTLYFVEATADLDGKPFKRGWSFTTGKDDRNFGNPGRKPQDRTKKP